MQRASDLADAMPGREPGLCRGVYLGQVAAMNRKPQPLRALLEGTDAGLGEAGGAMR